MTDPTTMSNLIDFGKLLAAVISFVPNLVRSSEKKQLKQELSVIKEKYKVFQQLGYATDTYFKLYTVSLGLYALADDTLKVFYQFENRSTPLKPNLIFLNILIDNFDSLKRYILSNKITIDKSDYQELNEIIIQMSILIAKITEASQNGDKKGYENHLKDLIRTTTKLKNIPHARLEETISTLQRMGEIK